jgi:hypothetical protein
MTIKLLTLKTNHTLMGKVTEDLMGAVITIKEPVQVVQVPPRAQNDPGSIAFAPFLEYATEFKDGFKIKKDDILVTSTPVVELENQYNQIFGSGITIASSIPKV